MSALNVESIGIKVYILNFKMRRLHRAIDQQLDPLLYGS